MTRTVSNDFKTELAKHNVILFYAVELDFDSGVVRLNNSGQNFTLFGNEFLGIGNLGEISTIEEGIDVSSRGINLSLSGVDPNLIAVALGDNYQGRYCKVWVVALNESYQVVNDPVQVFGGTMDTMPIELGETATINLTAESRLSDLKRARVRRYNNADQQAKYPTDKGFQYIAECVEKELPWGR